MPSAEERSRKYGNSPSYYRNLFTKHAQCQIDKTQRESSALLKQRKENDKRTSDTLFLGRPFKAGPHNWRYEEPMVRGG